MAADFRTCLAVKGLSIPTMSEIPSNDPQTAEPVPPLRAEAVRCDQSQNAQGSIQIQQISMSGLWAFILSLLGFFTCCFCPCAIPIGLVAIILACVSLLKCAGNAAMRGRGLAIAALILAILGMLISLVLWFFIFSSKPNPPQQFMNSPLKL